MVSFPGMGDGIRNTNATKERVLEQIEKYGPVSAKAIASALKVTEKQVMQRISYMVSKKKINIQKQGGMRRRQYFYDPDFPILGVPTMEETISEEEEDKLFDDLNHEDKEPVPMYPVSTPEKSPRGLDTLVNRCHHLVLALENCSSGTIMDSFNLDEEQARILMNKVVAKFDGMNVSFCINVIKEK